MIVRILTVSKRQPPWINAGFDEYAKRLRGSLPLELVEIPPADRHGMHSAEQLLQCKALEASRIKAHQRAQETGVALDERGRPLSTAALAEFLQDCRLEARPPAFIVGGADGLHPDVINSARTSFSLSGLTLPHGIVRVILAEALYRAWSLLNNHPYHRA